MSYDENYARSVKGSCDISFDSQPVEQKKEVMSMEQIPLEKQYEMRDYAVKLRKKFPHMKPDRLKKKVAEYFKVKLV